MNNTLGETIEERRKARGWTIKRLSAESGVSTAFISRIERGQRSPSATILRKLAKPSGITEVELLKLAGFLSRDDSDEHIQRVKSEVKKALAHLSRVLALLSQDIDNL